MVALVIFAWGACPVHAEAPLTITSASTLGVVGYKIPSIDRIAREGIALRDLTAAPAPAARRVDWGPLAVVGVSLLFVSWLLRRYGPAYTA
jgi:hypothetical protein